MAVYHVVRALVRAPLLGDPYLQSDDITGFRHRFCDLPVLL